MKGKHLGIIYIILAGLGFSLMTFFVRMAGSVPTLQKMFFRNAFAAVIAFVMLLRSPEKFHIRKDSFLPLLFRCLCGTSGMICNFYAIDHLSIADANILNKLSPFFAIIASYFLLKEKANKVQWACVGAAFIGAVFVCKPSMQMDFVYALIGVLGGLGAGVAYAFVRKLGQQGERSPVIVLCFSLFSCLVTLPFMLANYYSMSKMQWLYLILAGICAAGGQLFITAAYTKAPAKEISVFDYSQVIFAAVLGVIFLGEFPDWISLIGYAIIIGSAIFKWQHTLRTEKRTGQ